MSNFMFNQQHQQPQYGQYYEQPSSASNLQFYQSGQDSQFYASRPSLEGNMVSGAAGPSGGAPNFGGQIQAPQGWLSAFSPAGFEGEPPLLEELGVNFSHIWAKSMTVLNPLRQIDERIMDDADMAGPIFFFLAFGVFLLLSGRSQFGYIYGIALLGSTSIYALLNLMSTTGIDAYRTASVLGYCLLPMVAVSALSVGRNL
ncbi:transporter yip1 [Tulasnella sp. 427]|nr:transporter yip1 [Tulasnella sp. 427]